MAVASGRGPAPVGAANWLAAVKATTYDTAIPGHVGVLHGRRLGFRRYRLLIFAMFAEISPISASTARTVNGE